jgi:hypothetical protein
MRLIHQKLKKYGIAAGVTMKKIYALLSPIDCIMRIKPEPNTPANPVPDPKYPTTVDGNPLQKPKLVLSPKALTVPKITDATRDT